MELGADVLPARGHQDGAAGVQDGQNHVAGGGEAVAHALKSLEVDEVGQKMRSALHSSSPLLRHRATTHGRLAPADTPTAVCPGIPYAPDNGTRAVPGRCAVPGASAGDPSAGDSAPAGNRACSVV